MNIFKIKKLITITVAAVLAVPVFAQGALKQDSPERHGMNPEKLAQVDRVINEAITAKEIPGAVLSVVRGNSVEFLILQVVKVLVEHHHVLNRSIL